MLKQVAKALFSINGWSFENQIGSFGPKCILLAAPHTSNWDYIYGLVFFEKMGLEPKIAMKKEWFSFPFNKLIEPIGGLPIERGGKGEGGVRKSAVDAMADLFDQYDELMLVITPEGTRSRVNQWRTGFYHVAIKANVPIVLSYLDYPNKRGVVAKMIHPTGDIDADMKMIMEFYQTHGHGKFHNQFSVDERYTSA